MIDKSIYIVWYKKDGIEYFSSLFVYEHHAKEHIKFLGQTKQAYYTEHKTEYKLEFLLK